MPEYIVWRAERIKNTVIPPKKAEVQIDEELPKESSELEITKQEFEVENEKMRKKIKCFLKKIFSKKNVNFRQ